MRDNFHSLPANLPVPTDDGLCNHLLGLKLPNIVLNSTSDRKVNLREECEDRTVLFFYPRTGRPDEAAPVGWDEIPGARGCTPQSCSFRDHFDEFSKLGVRVFGISTQTTDFQKEFAARTKVPYELLSDCEFNLTESMKLPTFNYNSMRLLKRIALVVEKGQVLKVFYPVFPPDKNAEEVLAWLRSNSK